jgi:SAM-dependent methyltransferase
MNDKRWIKYYDITRVKTPPRKTLVTAIENFSNENIIFSKLAIDLGCGSGSDSIELLRHGWSVLAIDFQSAAITNLLFSAHQLSLLDNILKTKICSFETLTSLPPAYLINASFSLPFLNPDSFYKLWEIILIALHPGGRFSGSFFGIHDSWNTRSDMTFFKHEEIYDLFAQFKIEFFDEEEQDGPDALGYIKHWHKYLVVAKKY